MPAPLNVWSMLYYLTEVDGITWRQGDYDANKIIKAVKGEPLNGYLDITFSDRTVRRYTQSNVSDLLPVVFRTVADKLKAELATPFDIVPIPNSTATINDQSDCRIFEQARAVASFVGNGARVVPALRWKQERTPTSQGRRQPRSSRAL